MTAREAQAGANSGRLADIRDRVRRVIEESPDSPEADLAREILALAEQ